MGDDLIDVWFSLLGLSYSLAHMYKVLQKPFFHALWTLNIILKRDITISKLSTLQSNHNAFSCQK